MVYMVEFIAQVERKMGTRKCGDAQMFFWLAPAGACGEGFLYGGGAGGDTHNFRILFWVKHYKPCLESVVREAKTYAIWALFTSKSMCIYC